MDRPTNPRSLWRWIIGLNHEQVAVIFFAPGIPAPGGSKRAFVVGGRAIVTEDCKRSKPWRERVACAARDAYAGPPLNGPLRVEFAFVVPRPKGHFGTGKNARAVRPSAPAYPAVKPDTTKLVRSTEDALKSILWDDDSQIVQQVATKTYGDRPGVTVRVYELAGIHPIGEDWIR